jgi:hypothetical protein
VLGAQIETHNSLVFFTSLFFFYFASFLYSLKPYFFSLFFKTLLPFYSLKSWSSDFHCPMFPLISNITPEVSVHRLTDAQQPAAAAAASSQAARSSHPLQAANLSSFTVFIYSEKQGVGATVLMGEGTA